MIRRSTAIVLVVFILLVVLAWYLQKENNNDSITEAITSTPMASLFDLPSGSLTKIQLEETFGGRVIIQKDAQEIWSFLEPSGFEIDQAKAQSIAEKLIGLKVLSKMEKSPSLDVLGLDKPAYRIILTTDTGAEHQAIVGNLTSTSSGYYISRMGEIPVIVSKVSLDEILDAITNPPIFVTPTPSSPPIIVETQIPEITQTP